MRSSLGQLDSSTEADKHAVLERKQRIVLKSQADLILEDRFPWVLVGFRWFDSL